MAATKDVGCRRTAKLNLVSAAIEETRMSVNSSVMKLSIGFITAEENDLPAG
jgi:hypothetical protein